MTIKKILLPANEKALIKLFSQLNVNFDIVTNLRQDPDTKILMEH